ncbi:hypothetical protein D3H65_08725 [Paraflavitalea soli]|uniref:Uncharacterized protein n=1 Tax=Paraflavitalea soli TaxID=2315862 RepID=A0A3B7MLY6_9BACT|nr:hypothetical protein [Paraflavitalea soli]AXY74060.1 hypothetical protein D3H65_08725 [Paraflavitalea soli]
MSNHSTAALEPVLTIHKRLNELNSVISFCRDELKIYQRRLEEVVSKNTGKDILAQVEHFQNQFILQGEQLDVLEHKVNLRRNELEKLGKDPAIGALRVPEGGLEDELKATEQNHTETRKQFYRFLANVY